MMEENYKYSELTKMIIGLVMKCTGNWGLGFLRSFIRGH